MTSPSDLTPAATVSDKPILLTPASSAPIQTGTTNTGGQCLVCGKDVSRQCCNYCSSGSHTPECHERLRHMMACTVERSRPQCSFDGYTRTSSRFCSRSCGMQGNSLGNTNNFGGNGEEEGGATGERGKGE